MEKFAAAVQVIKLLLMLGGSIIEFIMDAEKVLVGKGKGAQKLSWVKAALETAFDALDEITLPFEEFWKTAEKFINKMVSIFNNDGTFTKS